MERFELERWQSVWENQVELNIAESGVEPLTVEELVADPEALRQVLGVPLGYPQTNGSEELRSRIAALYPGARAANVLVTCGCAEANYLLTWALVEPGDEVVFLEPNYMQIGGLARGFGATVKPFWLKEELGWAPDLDDLKRLVTPKTRLLAICNPNNPTGVVLSQEAMEAIGQAAARVGAWVLADEVYRGAEFAPAAPPSGAFQAVKATMTESFWGRYERVVCTGGLSKAYGLPGLRTGWVVGPADLVERLWSYHDYTSIAPTMLTDRLATLALEPARHARLLERTRRIVRENYPIVREWLSRHPQRLTHVPPLAGAIAWVGVRSRANTTEWAEAVRSRQSVLIVPGEQFGMASYLRIGFGGNAGHLQQALARLDEMLASL